MSDSSKLQKLVETPEGALPKPVKFIFRQDASAPTFHADGGWGILNHHNTVRIGFYTENPPTPKEAIQPVNPDGSPNGDQSLYVDFNNEFYPLVRDFQCNVVLPLTAAVQVHQMLGNFIKLLQGQAEQQFMEFHEKMKEAEAKKSSAT